MVLCYCIHSHCCHLALVVILRPNFSFAEHVPHSVTGHYPTGHYPPRQFPPGQTPPRHYPSRTIPSQTLPTRTHQFRVWNINNSLINNKKNDCKFPFIWFYWSNCPWRWTIHGEFAHSLPHLWVSLSSNHFMLPGICIINEGILMDLFCINPYSVVYCTFNLSDRNHMACYFYFV